MDSLVEMLQVYNDSKWLYHLNDFLLRMCVFTIGRNTWIFDVCDPLSVEAVPAHLSTEERRKNRQKQAVSVGTSCLVRCVQAVSLARYACASALCNITVISQFLNNNLLSRAGCISITLQT